MCYNEDKHITNTVRLRGILIFFGFTLLPIFAWFFWTWNQGETISQSLESFGKLGDSIKESVSSLPTIAPVKADNGYTIEDQGQNAIKITYANESDTQKLDSSSAQKLSLSFPKDIGSQPLAVNLPDNKAFTITSQSLGKDYTSSIISADSLDTTTYNLQPTTFFSKLFPKKPEAKYIKYESDDGRKIIYYSYQSDGSTGAKTLKHWTIYKGGDGNEKETYAFDKALLKKNEDGSVSVFYIDPNELKNQESAAGVDTNLLERAQRVLAQDAAENLDGREADAIIPSPYVLDKDGNKHDLTWVVSDDKKTLTTTYSLSPDLYPLALDPTLSFTAPAQSNTGDTITGEASSAFGSAMTKGDFNADGKIDLAVGAPEYSSNTGRVYIFYNDGALASSAVSADVVIVDQSAASFGSSVSGADLNADGKTDLVVGAKTGTYGASGQGRAYIFYNDGSYPRNADMAETIITGPVSSGNGFGSALATTDFNSDGRIDLAVGAANNYSAAGSVYIFYNDGSYPTSGGSADITITGEVAQDSFGGQLAAGDLNSDGKDDLVVNCYSCDSTNGRTFVFYNDGSVPTTAATADIAISGTNPNSLALGDFNSDSKVDIAVGSYNMSGYSGRVWIFYNDGSIPTTTATADVIISGEGRLGSSLEAGDFNADGRVDLASGAWTYGSNVGRAYIFYNDGSIPTTAATADVILTGESFSYFGWAITSGDFNADGKTDLVVGAHGYVSNHGKAYIFYSQNGQVNTNQSITGGASGDKFGQAMTTGDVNADGRTDLIVGAREYNPGGAANTGRVYIFYGDGQIPSAANSADVVIVGAATGNYFGSAMTTGDFNADGKVDLAVGANGTYSSIGGRVYIFYNDGSISTTAANADVIFTDEGTSNFGWVLVAGDYNADGKTDIVTSAMSYGSNNGRVYVFYDDGTNNFGTATCSGTPAICLAANADAIISINTGGYFLGSSFASGDFNADGKVDLAFGAYGGNGNTGYVYIFYNGSISTKWDYEANVTITGETSNNYFGIRLTSGDFNADGKTDLAVGAYGYSSNTGRTYIFYNDGSIPTTAATADISITGEASSNFGISLSAGDFNADGRTDLAVGGDGIATNTGKSYIFYNDGSIPTTAATADIIITGETTSNYFGNALTAGDMNGDGRVDLVVGAYGNATNTGKVYFYETRENFAWQLQKVSGTAASGGLRVQPNVTGQELTILGEGSSNYFGDNMTTGDFNTDGKTDLVVGARTYSSSRGRVYIFYNDGSLPAGAASADVVITGEAANTYFGSSLVASDFNADGRTDLAVGAYRYSTFTGRVYLFYNDGSIPATAATADVTVTGQNTNDDFGFSLNASDLNADGKTDLAVGAFDYAGMSGDGRVYIFYNGNFITENASGADIIISASGGNSFGNSLASGDFNSDGRTDLVVGANRYSNNGDTGRVYIFYNDGSIPTTDATADVIITGETTYNYFGDSLNSGDFNADGKIDLAVGAGGYSTNTGRVYLFYNGSIITEGASGADVIITGDATNNPFGAAMTVGDFNADGRVDLVVSASGYSTNTGRTYIFYNDGSIPATAGTADVIINGEATGNYFGSSLAALDANSDGKTDLAVGAFGYSSNRGKVYIYTLNDTVITGGATDYFGIALASGDFNADGRTDLAVGASRYSTNQGKTYIFYNDGAYPTAAGSADATITGEAASNFFGYALTAADMNYDGKTDLVVGAYGHNTNVGRAYIFYNGSITTENASGGDVIITGEAGSMLGAAFTTGDFNVDGRVDLLVGSVYGGTGRAYLFYNDGTIPTTGAGADVIFTGQANSSFSQALAAGDFNSDGKTDIAVGGPYYNNNYVGRVYLYYADGTNNYGTATCSGTPAICAATDADVIIDGQSGITGSFGYALAAGDLNADGRTDLAVGAKGSAVYIFYNDGSYPSSYTGADVAIAQESAGDEFGWFLLAGDLNADGRTDLVVDAKGATFYSNNGRVYIFYNDGAYPTSAGSADVIFDGELYSYFGTALASGDFNTDGKIDLAVGAYGYSTSTGRVYLIMSEAAVETQPNVTKVRGTIKVKGTVKIR
jgi:hypothetical protein